MLVLPRLAREPALQLLATLPLSGLKQLAAAMPDTGQTVTYTPVGGTRISDGELSTLRDELVTLAREHGMPYPIQNPSEFEGRAARLLRQRLDISPNEASHEEVWTYLTCCWLLDVAVWRFGSQADPRRFIGNINRNTFRRLWWRAEVLGPDIDLTQLGEDELVNIMERPTIAADLRLARGVAREFLSRVDRGAAESRMQLMRDAMKRLLRLTPVVSFAALDDNELESAIEEIFNAAAVGITDQPAGTAGRHRALEETPQSSPRRLMQPSAGVLRIPRLMIYDVAFPPRPAADAAHDQDFDGAVSKALQIARTTGRVTNTNLREMAAITSGEAREVLQALVRDGALARRGVRRGTYYVLAEAAADESTRS
ncbi:hypothetical protein AU198_19065 [Mycobacterium sp. GA-1199]|uniref:DUF6339 family protein n=1 Tax=Mycobacterium sp. GA-1199 TaxID=1772287 RepID=UPI0007487DD4|nr:DUF6339 family protein [Mycobacterium sp. GA-1199]KUI48132.1 hypothetical protein AU198_19065 [Mycobacterium sp. GA-1199]